MKHLVLFGDSLFGRFNKDLIERLESQIRSYEVYNFVAVGWDSRDALKKAPFIARCHPDAVAISLGATDAAPWKQVPPEEFKGNLKEIFVTFKESKIIYCPPPIVNEAKGEGDMIRFNKEMKVYVEAARNICQESDVIFIDSWKAFQPLVDKGEDYHMEDGVHPNALGFNIMINSLSKVVVNL